MILPSFSKAFLVLIDGTIFSGYSIGINGYTVGEIVFNTSMTGYQEIITDPSYSKQIVLFTYPHIGNVGINEEDIESSKIQISGLIVNDIPNIASNFRMKKSLREYIYDEGIVGISGIDTRKLTRIQRKKGNQIGAIIVGCDKENIISALKYTKSFNEISDIDIVQSITTKKPFIWNKSEWKIQKNWDKKLYINNKKIKNNIVVFDFGVKYNILRMLVERGCNVHVVPAKTNFKEALSFCPDGIFLSNGPGDPNPCLYAVESVKKFLDYGIPIFGVCFGHQIIALSLGAKVIKMKIGHHGSNHPVQDIKTGKVFITTQNHNFVIDPNYIPKNVKITHISLFDNSIQGIEIIDKPVFSFQGHPEASPGPKDINYLFDKFISLINNYKNKSKT